MVSEMKVLEGARSSTRELNRSLRAVAGALREGESARVAIEEPRGRHHIAAGLTGPLSIEIKDRSATSPER
jgi:lysophospholipid acyltransferase (LPLAT)-like uncharacterized protein